jgi:putative sigma-54 modulation protein
MDVTEALKQYAVEKFGKLEKYLPKNIQVTVTLSVVKKVHHIAEAMLKTDGLLVQAHEETEEMYSSIDLLIEKLEKRIRKYKEKLVDHKHQSRTEQGQPVASVHPDDRIPQIIKTKRFDLKPMHAEEAVMQMELLDKEFYVFSNAASGHITVIYRRKDGNVGLIEPAL